LTADAWENHPVRFAAAALRGQTTCASLYALAPRRPPGLAGFFVKDCSVSETVQLFVDYQNVHLTGHQQFGPQGAPAHLSLIHPGLFADVVDSKRALESRPGTISHVFVFRGLPSAEHEPDSNRRNQAQAAEWTRDARVVVQPRPLRYPPTWPGEKAREKGIDVLLATRFVRAAILHLADVLILASRDTDLEPAIELAASVPNAPVIEVCNWAGRGRLCRQLRPQPWCTYLDGTDFLTCLDTRQY